MFTRNWSGWVTAAAAAAMVATLAGGVMSAQNQGSQGAGAGSGRGMMMRQGPMGMARLALGRLGLSDDQKQKVKAIMAGHQAEFAGVAGRMAPARKALFDAVASDDEAAIRQRSADLAAVQADMAVLAGKVRGEVFKILTPDQQKKAESLRQQVEQRMDQRRARGRAGKGGDM
jgi:Spy/CpxP family protein refolding chaperone